MKESKMSNKYGRQILRAHTLHAKEIVLDVAYGRLPRESGKSMLMSFFGLTSEQAE